MQKRFAHHIGKKGDPATVARIQAVADRNIERFGLLDGEEDKEMIIPVPAQADARTQAR